MPKPKRSKKPTRTEKPINVKFAQFGKFGKFGKNPNEWWWVSVTSNSPNAQRVGPFHGPFPTEDAAVEHWDAMTARPGVEVVDGGDWDPKWDEED
jgi:hypothetical protein